MRSTFCFHPDAKKPTGKPWRFACAFKASKARDEIYADGRKPGGLWAEKKDPRRALRAAWYREDMTIRQVLARLNRVLKREGLIDESIGCPLAWDNRAAADAIWFNMRGQVAVFATCRSNEAHYLRVALLKPDGKYAELFSAKLWRGLENAMAVANRVTELLGA